MQIFLRVLADGSTSSLWNALYIHHRSRFDIASQGIWAKRILTWGSDSTCLGEILKLQSSLLTVWSIVSVNCMNIGKIWLSNMNFLCELTIVIARLPCLLNIAQGVSSTVVPVYSETSDSVNSFNFAMCACASKCFSIELVPWSDWWQRTWWHTIHMMPGLQVCSIVQCK